VNKTNLTQELGQLQLEAILRLIDSKIITLPLSFYQELKAEAKKGISRDFNDWETVALALPDAFGQKIMIFSVVNVQRG
jgi:hypothetical protein